MDNGRRWWVTLLQGIIAILLGIYLLFGGEAAAGNFALVAGLYILIVGLLELWRGRGTVSRYRGIIGVIVGALVLLLKAVDIFPTYWDFTIFAIGAIIVGALGLYASFFARSGRDFQWGPVFINALLLLWGIMIFFTRAQDRDLQTISGLILSAIGVILLLWGFFSRDKGEPDKVTPPEPEKPAAPDDGDSPIDDTIEDVTS